MASKNQDDQFFNALRRKLNGDDEEKKTKETNDERFFTALRQKLPASGTPVKTETSTPQPTAKQDTSTQTGRLRPGWSVEDVVEAAEPKNLYQKALDKIDQAKDKAEAARRFGNVSTEDLLSYVPTSADDKRLYEAYMGSRLEAAKSLERQSKQAKNDAEKAGNEAEAYREFLGMPGASDEEIFGLAQAVRENNAQAKSLEPQRWLEYAEGLKESQARKDSLTEKGRELGSRATAANEQGQAWEYSNIIKGYGSLINSPDFAVKSQYVAPKESAVNIWEKDKNDPRLRYMAANGDGSAQTLLQHNAQNDSNSYNALTGSFSFGAGSIYDLGGDNDYLFELTDTEKGVYNALYASSPEAADNFLDKLKPYLDVRARDTYTKRMAELANEAPGAMSVVSVGANIPQSLEYAVQLGELLSDGKINQNNPAYRASQMSNTIRGEVSKIAEEKWGKAGSAAYNLGMSFADFLTTTALSGGSKALSLGLMGTRVAANTVLNLKDRGYDDTAAFTLGTIAGAAEIVTESFSLETILNPDLLADGIARYLAKSFLAEASEEGASNLINLAAENIYDAITGNNEAEWKQQVYDAIQNGADPNDAVLAAIQSNLVQLGTDVLSGGISGFLMAGAATPIHVNNFNNSQQGQYANAIRGDEEGLQALIQSGLESPQNTESYQLAQAALKQFADGKAPSALDVARLVEANQQQINNETAEQSGQGRFRLTLPRTTPQNAPTPEQVETLRQIGAPLPAGVNTAQDAPPVPQETRNTPGLTLPARTEETAEGAAETPRLTLPARTTEDGTAEAPRLTLPTSEQIAAFEDEQDTAERAAQDESELVERLAKSKPGLMVDDYAMSKLSESEIRAIDETARRLGLRVGFIDLGVLKDSNAKIYDNGVVLIEKGNQNPIGYLYGHEMSHWLQQNSAEAYNEFAEAARATDPEWFKYREEEYNAELRKSGKEMSPEEIQDEILCDYAGWLVKDADVLNRFINQNKDKPNVLRRLYEAIKALAAKLTGREKRQADTAADLLLRAMNETEANVQNGIMSTGETRSSFGGILAQHADMEAQERAEDLHTRGNRTKERGPSFNNFVRRRTGWFKGGDGMWRFEIDDHNSSVSVDESMGQLRDNQYSEIANLLYRWNHNLSLTSDEWDYVEDYLATSDENEGVQLPSGKAQKFASGHGTIGDVLEHEELYRQYPFIATVPLKFENLGPTTLGSTSDSGITLNTNLLKNESELRSTLLHEIQHLIQREEGFARGSNTRHWQSAINHGMDTTRPSEVNALKEYNRIKSENPDLVRDAIKLDQMFNKNHDDYDILVDRDGVAHSDEWVSKETGEIVPSDEVWGEYEKFRSEMDDKYGKVLDEYYDVLAALASSPEDAELLAITGPKPRSAFEMYEDTYGEAEARNVEFRAHLDPEQAKDMPPFTGDEDSVFVENKYRLRNGAKSSMKGINADTAPDSIAADGYPTDMKRFDDDYMTALDAGDRNTMSSMVRAAAVRAGYDSPLLMHGTSKFGFTKFDRFMSDDHRSFFLTSDKRTAGSYYYGPNEIREINSTGSHVDYSTLSPKELLDKAIELDYDTYSGCELLDESDRAVILGEARDTIEKMRSIVIDQRDETAIDPDTGEITSENLYDLFDELIDSMDELAGAQTHDEIDEAWNRIVDADWAFEDLEIKTDEWGSSKLDNSWLTDDGIVRYNYNELAHAKSLLDDLTRSEALYRDFDVSLSLLSPYASHDIQLIPASTLVHDLERYNNTSAETAGIYQFYCSPGKQLVIDCNNSNWDDIDIPQATRNELHLYGRTKTRDVSKAAYDLGYDSIWFRDIHDNGGYTDWSGASGVYIYFDGARVKSADPVTIDDNGEVIKPSERFKPVNEFRRSLKGLNADIAPESIQKYGQIPKGEKPARDINVPRKVTDKPDERVSWTARTALEAKATPDAAIPGIAELVEKGAFSYKVQTNKAAIENAEATIKDKGWSASLADWVKDVTAGKVNKANTAMGWALYNNAANAGDLDTALNVLDLMVRHQRNAAQALQASRILKQLSPEAQLYGVQRSVDNLVKELQERYGKRKNIDIKINRDLAQAFLDAKTEEERQKALKALYKDIGRQIPATFLDKWNAWRYLAMLGNPRTHVRNVAGNTGFAPVVLAKDQVATALESIASAVSKGKVERTKGLVLPVRDHDLVKAAWGRYQSVRDQALGEGKYNDSQMANKWIEEGRTIFKFKPLELARRGNSAALDVEDVWFSQPHYTYALAQYCKANGITPAQIRSGEGMDKADAYAIKEAQKATYRDVNAFSSFVSSLGRAADRKSGVGKAASAVLEGVLPFRKTPANILVRGLEYSPVGLLKSLTYDLAQVMRTDADGNPRMSVAEMLDDVSEGLTGTGLLALGALLVKLGLLRGHGEDEKKERDFYDLMGYQNYALTLPNGKSHTLDWLAPEVLPLLVGANIYEKLQQSKGDVKMSDIIDAIGQISEPMLEMSMLQSLNDLLDSVGYAKEEGLSALSQTLSSAVTSYLTQAIPTLLGQGERTGEKLRMTTYTDKNKWLTKSMQYTLGKISAKIPGWDYDQIPYIDAWGRTEVTGDGWVDRAVKNMVNPAYTDQTRMSDMEAELLRLYNVDPDKYGSVLPTSHKASKYLTHDKERIDLTGEQYVAYATTKGQMAYDLITELTESDAYKNASDEDKAKMVDAAYDYAATVAKGELLESLGKTYEDYDKLKDRLDKGADIMDMIVLAQEIKNADAENNANSSYDTLEILSAFEALNLPEAKAEPLMEQKISESQWERYNTLKDAGVNYDTRLDIMRKYSELYADDNLKPGEKALEFSRYVDSLNLTSEQTQLVKDTYKFWSQVPAEAARYETFKQAGLDEDKSKHTSEVLSALEPLPGKEAVTDLQRYRAIAADKVLTDKEKLIAIGCIMGTELKTEKGNSTQWAKFNLALNNGQSLSQAIDLCENGRLDEFEKWTESAAKGQKVTWDVYDTFLKETADLAGDKDANGKTISGSLKKKVVAYIDSLNLTPDQKDALLTDYNSTYKHDVTWHSGSYGSSGSGKTYARANLSRLELPRTNTTRQGRLTLSRR